MAWSHSCCLSHPLPGAHDSIEVRLQLKMEQLVCWEAKWHLCRVGNQNLESEEPKSFPCNCMDLL